MKANTPRQATIERSEFLKRPARSLGCLCLCLLACFPAAAAAFRFAEVNDKSLGLWEGNHPVFVYNHGVIIPTNAPADRARGSYVHPLYGLDGEVLTDDFPKDHYHHRGLFWAWPHVKVGAQETDLWMLKGIRHQFGRWLRRDADKSGAVLGVQNGWYIGERKVVNEEVWLRALPESKDSRALDVELALTPLDEPLTLRGAEGKSYGGLTLRFTPFQGKTTITTPEGRTPEDLPIAHLPWADLSAQWSASGKTSGAAIFISPSHPDFPPEWLTRHYGVLCVGWPGVEARTFPVGKTFRCAYRVWIHRGIPELAALKEAYAEYARSSTNATPISATSTDGKTR